MKCEMCTENDKEGMGWESGSEGCRGAEHGQNKNRTGAVAVRTALESAVLLRRCEEVKRQAKMANPTKCGDLPQRACPEWLLLEDVTPLQPIARSTTSTSLSWRNMQSALGVGHM
jgi:hypothetical protein